MSRWQPGHGKLVTRGVTEERLQPGEEDDTDPDFTQILLHQLNG